MKTILLIMLIIILIETFLQIIIPKLKKKFQWILFPKDIYPKFNNQKFKNYLKQSYNKNLGWIRKSNIKGYDKVDNKKIEFNIYSKGYRKQINSKKKNKIASFGGSFVFGRQVKDHQTWQEQISKTNNYNITNYGVGNYGTDQAILRYKYTKFEKNTKIVLLGIVPEHICRIQSEWKHFFEFGNIHGFKPKFYLKNKKLFLKKNPLNKDTKIKEIRKIINRCMKSDRFYEEKFKKNIFEFPFLISFFKNFIFNSKILFLFIFFKNNAKINDLFLKEVMQRNIVHAHKFYNEKYSKILFIELIRYFKKIAKEKKHVPYLIVFPQKLDIINTRTNKYYINFFKNQISKEIKTLDLTVFFNKKNSSKLFINQNYGGHLNSKGNKFVANIINKFLNKFNV